MGFKKACGELSYIQSSILLFSLLATGLFCDGCGQTNSRRETEQSQNESHTQTEQDNLIPALGRFEGHVKMKSSGKSYEGILELAIVSVVIPSPQDPTQTLSIPKINGTLTFPILAHAASGTLGKYMDLLEPLDFFDGALFASGDYDERKQSLNLPYEVAEFPGRTWGEFQGKLDRDHFSGEWVTKAQGDVGQFSFLRVTGSEMQK